MFARAAAPQHMIFSRASLEWIEALFCRVAKTRSYPSAKLGKGGRRVVRRNEEQDVIFAAEDISKSGVAHANGLPGCTLYSNLILPVGAVGLNLRPSPMPRKRAGRQTFRFSADVFPRFATSSYSTTCPSLRLLSPAFSTAEIWTNTSFPPPCG